MDITTETVTETIEHKTFVIKLDEAELTRALVDARPLQRELRKARNSQIGLKANWATNGYADHTPRAQKKRGRKPGRPAKSAAQINDNKVQCECGDWFAVQGLGPHHRKCAKWQLKRTAEAAMAGAA